MASLRARRSSAATWPRRGTRSAVRGPPSAASKACERSAARFLITSMATSIEVTNGLAVASLRTAPAAAHSPVSRRLAAACAKSSARSGPKARPIEGRVRSEPAACTTAIAKRSASGALSGRVAKSSAAHTPARS